jgi:hypothetical protein
MTKKKQEFKYPLKRRPPRRSLNSAEAAAKTFGVIEYTARRRSAETLRDEGQVNGVASDQRDA